MAWSGMRATLLDYCRCTYNRGLPVVQDLASVAAFLARVGHTWIVSAALEINWEKVAFRVVCWPIIHDLCVGVCVYRIDI